MVLFDLSKQKISRRGITRKDVDFIVKHEASVYPIEETLTLLRTRLIDWYLGGTALHEQSAKFAQIYEHESSGEVEALWLVMPLRPESYYELISGKRKELDMQSQIDFVSPVACTTGEATTGVGLHVFHIARYQQSLKPFTQVFLQDLSHVIEILRTSCPATSIVGFSGYCTSKEGIAMFSKMGCSDRPMISVPEYVMHRQEDPENTVVVVGDQQVQQYKKQGWLVVNKCSMMVVFPDEKAVVWQFVKPNLQNLQPFILINQTKWSIVNFMEPDATAVDKLPSLSILNNSLLDNREGVLNFSQIEGSANFSQIHFLKEPVDTYAELCESRNAEPIFEFIFALSNPESNSCVLSKRKTKLNDNDIVCLRPLLQSNKTITELDLNGNLISKQGSIEIASILQENTVIEKLGIGSNSIEDDGFDEISRAIARNMYSPLKYLDIQNSNLTHSSVPSVLNLLHIGRITSLNLAKNKFHDKSALMIAEQLKLVNSLTSLSLKANEIGDTGAISIAKMLEVNTSLQELDLSDNFIGDSGVQELTKSLAKNTTLQRLNISSNRFSKIEGGVLRTSFSSLKELNLSHNLLENQTILSIADALQCNTTLEHLDMQGVRLNSECIQSFATVFQESHTTMRLRVDIGDTLRSEVTCITNTMQGKESLRNFVIGRASELDEEDSRSTSLILNVNSSHVGCDDDEMLVVKEKMKKDQQMITSLQETVDNLSKKLVDAVNKMEEIQQIKDDKISQLREIEMELTEERKRSSLIQNETNAEMDKLAKELNEKAVAIAEQDIMINKLQKTIQHLNASIEEEREKANSVQSQLEHTSRKVKELTHYSESLISTIEQQTSEQLQWESKLHGLEKKSQEDDEKIQRLEESIEKKIQQLLNVEQQILVLQDQGDDCKKMLTQHITRSHQADINEEHVLQQPRQGILQTLETKTEEENEKDLQMELMIKKMNESIQDLSTKIKQYEDSRFHSMQLNEGLINKEDVQQIIDERVSDIRSALETEKQLERSDTTTSRLELQLTSLEESIYQNIQHKMDDFKKLIVFQKAENDSKFEYVSTRVDQVQVALSSFENSHYIESGLNEVKSQLRETIEEHSLVVERTISNTVHQLREEIDQVRVFCTELMEDMIPHISHEASNSSNLLIREPSAALEQVKIEFDSKLGTQIREMDEKIASKLASLEFKFNQSTSVFQQLVDEKLERHAKVLGKMTDEARWIEEEGIRLRVEHEARTDNQLKYMKSEVEKMIQDSTLRVLNNSISSEVNKQANQITRDNEISRLRERVKQQSVDRIPSAKSTPIRQDNNFHHFGTPNPINISSILPPDSNSNNTSPEPVASNQMKPPVKRQLIPPAPINLSLLGDSMEQRVSSLASRVQNLENVLKNEQPLLTVDSVLFPVSSNRSPIVNK